MPNNTHHRDTVVNKTCKRCKVEKDAEKDFRPGSKNQCKACDYEVAKEKRKERWEYLGLDMSSKY